jgi:predicted transcriptional regulator
MPLVSIRLPDDVDEGLAREAQRTQRPKSEIARDAIVDYLLRTERERFLAEIARAARADADDAVDFAEQSLAVDNEALALGEGAVHERQGVYRTRRTRKKPRR